MKTFNTLLCLTCCILIVSCGEKSADKKTGTDSQTAAATPAIVNKPNVVEPRAAFDTLHDGDFTMRYPNGVIQMKGFYTNGKRNGEWVAFFPSGKTQSEGFFTNGKRDHKAVVYYEDGKVMYEGNYTAGVMTGIWKYYNPDGSLSKEINCGDGTKK